MLAPALPIPPSVSARYRTSVAPPHEVAAAQRLRFRVFAEEGGARTDPMCTPAQRDADEWEDVCDHLIVCGRPAHDRTFGSAEFHVLVPLADVAARLLRVPGNGRR